jgi:hypothetical protein
MSRTIRTSHDVAFEIAMNATIPARTDTYSPIAHSDFLEGLARKIRENRMRIMEKRFYVNMNGNKLVGYYTIEDENMETDPDFGIQMMMGFKNSYDKSMTAALAAGANVMICSNGMISGSMVRFTRKHTGTIFQELQEKFNEAVQTMRTGFARMILEVDLMKEFELTPKQKAEILGVMYFEKSIVTPNQLSVVKRELSHSEHFKGNSVWDLYNNVTEALKDSHPIRHIEDHIKVHDFMTEVAGINIEVDGMYNADGTRIEGGFQPVMEPDGEIIEAEQERGWSDEGAENSSVPGIEASPTYGRNRPN